VLHWKQVPVLSVNISKNTAWIVKNELDLSTGEERTLITPCVDKEITAT